MDKLLVSNFNIILNKSISESINEELKYEITLNENESQNLSLLEYNSLKNKNISYIALKEISPILSLFSNNKYKKLDFINQKNSFSTLDSKSSTINSHKKNEINLYNWEIIGILLYYKLNSSLIEIDNDLQNKMVQIDKEKNINEQNLRNEQESEIQQANIKHLSLDYIVNQHMIQLIEFTNNYNNKYIELLNLFKDIYNNEILQSFLKYKDLIISKSFFSKYKNDHLVLLNKNKEKNINKEYIFQLFKLNTIIGIINRTTINFSIFIINDLFNTRIRDLFVKDENNLYSNSNYIYKKELINEIDFLNENSYILINYITYNEGENKIESLINFNKEILGELYFENILSLFNQVEKLIKIGKNPNNFDIFVSRHSKINSFNMIFNVYLNEFNKENFINSLDNIIIYANFYYANTLIFPMHSILDSFFRINKYTEFRIFTHSIRNIIEILITKYNSISENRM